MKQLAVVTRSFQAGTGGQGKPFDAEMFAAKVADPIRKILFFSEVVSTVIVVTNGETGSRLAENYIADGVTPTVAALRETFPKEVNSGRLIPVVCQDWGRNPGSARAINVGIRIAETKDCDQALIWSPELKIDGCLLAKALGFIERRALHVCGFLRERWWERTQWNVVQNTGAIWSIQQLLAIGRFDPQCDGTGKTIATPEFGEVLLAGLEDFHAMLRLMKSSPDFRWGMIGREAPLHWDVSFPPGSEREKNHLIKVARQSLVMREWACSVFPELGFVPAMNRLFSCYHQE